jgi:hypothetical protein
MSTFLTPEEVQELTGYKLNSAQRRWLTDRGWKHAISADGRPKVLRAEMEKHMLTGATRAPKQIEPNWAAMDSLGSSRRKISDQEFAARIEAVNKRSKRG